MSNIEAAARGQLHLCSVPRWRRRWAQGDFSLEDEPGRGCKADFPPLDHALVKAIACELLAETQQPLRRQSLADGTARAQHALGTSIRRSTGWRIVAQDALKPWRYQDWSLPRDPRFAEKAGPILDLYGGQSLGPKDDVLSADEKTSMQARIRCHPSLPPGPGRPASIEHAYERGGAWQYLAAWDGHRGDVMGRCAPTTGIDPFGRRVNQVLAEEPYVPAHGCSGLSTMARRIAEQPRYSACSKLIPVAFWSITGPRQLAQSSRNLLLYHPTEGTHSQ